MNRVLAEDKKTCPLIGKGLPGTTSNVEGQQIGARVAVEDRATDPGHIPDLRRGQRGQGFGKGRSYGELRFGPGFGNGLGRDLPENFCHVGQGDAGAEVPGVSRLLEAHLGKNMTHFYYFRYFKYYY